MMPRHVRNLLLLGALCWVAPVSAQRVPAAEHHGSGCPYAHASADLKAQSGDEAGGLPLFGRNAFLP